MTTHLTVSVGWAGALAVFLAHAAVAVATKNVDIAKAAGLAMAAAAWFVILPLCFATLVTGVAQGLGTSWGLLRHYWVLAKLVLTVFATAILLLKLGPISALADVPVPGLDVRGLRMSLLVHAIGGLVILLTAIGLAAYKPVGLTGFGARRQAGPAPGRFWRYGFWIGAAVLAALVLLMLASGGHGPTAHPH